MQELEPKPPKIRKLTKLKSASLITLILCHLFAALIVGGVVRPALASSEIYSVQNTIYLNVTEPWLGASSSDGDPPADINTKVISLTVKDDGSVTAPGMMHIQDEGGLGFTPEVQQSLQGLVMQQHDLSPGVQSISVGGKTIDISRADRKVGSVDYFGNFTLREPENLIWGQADLLSAPVIKKSVLFDSPENVAQSFCAANGYTLVNIVNSSYDETVNTNLLNLYNIKPAEHEIILYDTTGSLNTSSYSTQIAGITAAVIIIVVGMVIAGLTIYGIAATQQWAAVEHHRIDAMVTIKGIEAQQAIAEHASDNLLDWQKYILDAYTDGNLTWDEAMSFLQAGGAPYSNVLGNASTNIENILDTYYEHVREQYPQYSLGAGFSYSWTDVLFWIVIAIIAGFSIYIVYVLIKRWGNKQEIRVVHAGVV
ncbi:MAG: hypothetical protein ACTSSI_08440 [Candidatus Helarchaeota archaeon]